MSAIPAACSINAADYNQYYYVVDPSAPQMGIVGMISVIIAAVIFVIYKFNDNFERWLKWTLTIFSLITILFAFLGIIGLGMLGNAIRGGALISQRINIIDASSIPTPTGTSPQKLDSCISTIQYDGSGGTVGYISSKSLIQFQFFCCIVIILLLLAVLIGYGVLIWLIWK